MQEKEITGKIKRHKRSITEPLQEEVLDSTLSKLKNAIQELEPKQQQLFAEWIDTRIVYLGFEKDFQPEKLRAYERGEIILVSFGYNVGSELGGSHFAVVIENGNNPHSGTLTVVPISSLDENKSKDKLHPTEVYIGKLFPDAEKESYAKVLQIKTISKLRIIRPKKQKEKVYKLSDDILDQIDQVLQRKFTKFS